MSQNSPEQDPISSQTDPVQNLSFLPSGFLANTPIATTEGLKTIESLTETDILLHNTPHHHENLHIQAIHHFECTGETTHKNHEELKSWPICIRESALSDHVPTQDIWVSPTLVLSLWGTLIPCFQLVNGRSIYYDKSKRNYRLYQIETIHPYFLDIAGITALLYHQNMKDYQLQLAPLAISSRYQHALSNRSTLLNFNRLPPTVPHIEVQPFESATQDQTAIASTPVNTSPSPTEENDSISLLLSLEDGTLILPLRQIQNNYFFRIPGQQNFISILTDQYFEETEDTALSSLPLLEIGKIYIWQKDTTIPITTHLEATELEGWEDTDGASPTRKMHIGAMLPLSYEALAPSVIVQIEIKLPT